MINQPEMSDALHTPEYEAEAARLRAAARAMAKPELPRVDRKQMRGWLIAALPTGIFRITVNELASLLDELDSREAESQQLAAERDELRAKCEALEMVATGIDKLAPTA